MVVSTHLDCLRNLAFGEWQNLSLPSLPASGLLAPTPPPAIAHGVVVAHRAAEAAEAIVFAVVQAAHATTASLPNSCSCSLDRSSLGLSSNSCSLSGGAQDFVLDSVKRARLALSVSRALGRDLGCSHRASVRDQPNHHSAHPLGARIMQRGLAGDVLLVDVRVELEQCLGTLLLRLRPLDFGVFHSGVVRATAEQMQRCVLLVLDRVRVGTRLQQQPDLPNAGTLKLLHPPLTFGRFVQADSEEFVRQQVIRASEHLAAPDHLELTVQRGKVQRREAMIWVCGVERRRS